MPGVVPVRFRCRFPLAGRDTVQPGACLNERQVHRHRQRGGGRVVEPPVAVPADDTTEGVDPRLGVGVARGERRTRDRRQRRRVREVVLEAHPPPMACCHVEGEGSGRWRHFRPRPLAKEALAVDLPEECRMAAHGDRRLTARADRRSEPRLAVEVEPSDATTRQQPDLGVDRSAVGVERHRQARRAGIVQFVGPLAVAVRLEGRDLRHVVGLEDVDGDAPRRRRLQLRRWRVGRGHVENGPFGRMNSNMSGHPDGRRRPLPTRARRVMVAVAVPTPSGSMSVAVRTAVRPRISCRQ